MMRFSINLLSLVAVLSCLTLAKSAWNQEARNHILDIHNDKRRNEGGCHMKKMEYDQDLEHAAKKWARACTFDHDYTSGVGENLAWYGGDGDEVALIDMATSLWFGEKEDFDPKANTCGAACHYTQMVWANTTNIGCYSVRNCEEQRPWYLVCKYSPQGNMRGQQPYPTKCSTPCEEGWRLDHGLCVVKEPCDDSNKWCADWAQKGNCDNKYKYWMRENCKVSCGTCYQ